LKKSKKHFFEESFYGEEKAYGKEQLDAAYE
jgi:hypothetical protein